MTIRNLKALFICLVALFFLLFLAEILSGREAFVYETLPEDIRAEEARWKERIEKVGARAAYEELVRATQGLALTEQHEPAHIFGAALYQVEGIDGLSVCDNRLLYGCFHEFLSRVIVEHGLSIVPELEKRCPESPGTDAPISCQHGLGHGLLAYFGYGSGDLKQAIQECDKLTMDPWRACSRGAFMEYQLRFFLAGDGVEARAIPDGDYYDPCEEYSGIHASRCVGLLPVWWRVVVFPDLPSDTRFSWAGETCRALPRSVAEHKATCFRGIGFIAVTTHRFDPDHVQRLCKEASELESEMRECMKYASVTLNTEGGTQGSKLCQRLPEEARANCEYFASSVPLI